MLHPRHRRTADELRILAAEAKRREISYGELMTKTNEHERYEIIQRALRRGPREQ